MRQLLRGGGLNQKAFINAHNFKTLNDLLEQVIAIDKDENLFKQMLSQPVFADPTFVPKKQAEMLAFLDNIFSQTPKQANRRKNEYFFKNYDFDYKLMTSLLQTRERFAKTLLIRILKKLKIIKLIKKIFPFKP
ncbi:hypothetical protein [Helicobacter sp. 11S02596-1]|uniref:hypothetical protein n=1 Tax=Helicobacter sp. 11S02596-1 TaxID=1476194 RepID=UPI000BA775DD|nr:hypothetical protein [Helicobacter sp. 11S02596-1]PAF45156.1 hypothetical protein BJI48_00905 [Helicobacter sp. 11S02596-1]